MNGGRGQDRSTRISTINVGRATDLPVAGGTTAAYRGRDVRAPTGSDVPAPPQMKKATLRSPFHFDYVDQLRGIRFDVNLYAPVHLASLGSVVRSLGLRFAPAAGNDARSGNTLLGEVSSHRTGSSLREVLVVIVRS